MFVFNWSLIIPITIGLYTLTILFLPFSSVYATIMLFSLIAFWSRLPGVCILEPARVLYMMDFIDIFCIIIAVYVNPFYGALFAFIWNVLPWFCGGMHIPLLAIVKDGGGQALTCLFLPLINILVGGDLLLLVTAFTIIRIPLFLIFSLFLPTRPWPEQIVHTLIASVSLFIVNAFYAKVFGDFFTGLLAKGAAFSWTLFFIATLIFIVFSIVILGISPKQAIKGMHRNAKKIAKKATKKSFKKSEEHKQRDEMRRLKKCI